MRPGCGLRLAVVTAALLVLVAPVAVGLGFTLFASFGHVPGLAGLTSGWPALAVLPGLWTSLTVTLFTGIGATLVSLALALALTIAIGPRAGRWIAVPLAMPHAALAVGLAFLLAPSGWIARLLAPLMGWDRPPALATLHDNIGWALLVGLVVKEMPFLLLVALAAASRLPLAESLRTGRALGHPPISVWLWAILPQLLRMIRLPMLVVLAYGLSVVDMAILLGPSNPPTLAVLVTRAFAAPDPAALPMASAGAMLVVAIVAGAAAVWRIAGSLIWRALTNLIGYRLHLPLAPLVWLGRAMIGLGLAAGPVLVLWSFAGNWRWPQVWPASFSLQVWSEGQWLAPLGLSALIGLAVTALSVALAIAWLEAEDRGHLPRAGWPGLLIALPLVLPQIGLMIGMTMLLSRAGLTGGMLAVIWAQLLFVFPYVMLVLAGPWRALPPAPLKAAASLGAGPGRRLVAVKLPLLLRPLAVAAAVGFAVSVAQYLPVLFAGAGRVATLTTEALALASGSDRRLLALVALWQVLLPLAGYGLALALPRWLHRHRAGMRGGA